ncbi:DNA-binding protein [Candidatus Sumerlaeota bacterium]|nr:DNA-binding protein [Candidatus Sumerlaeota bacterium]
MTNITIAVPDDRLEELRVIAARFRVTPEELVQVSLEEILTRPDEAFRSAASYVLKKNAELYERLA